MKADHLSYSRAASVCMLGLVLQLVMGLTLLIYALIGRDHAGMSMALMVLTGSIVWLSLAIVFDQHRRERVEAIEAETLSNAGAASSVFEQNPDDLRLAARRLAWMHRFLLPSASIVLAATYLSIGLTRFFSGRGLFDQDKFVLPPERGWAVAIGLALAVIGFIFARFVSGMAKQAVWGNLRGGAATAVGAAVLGLAMAIGHFVQIAGSDVVLRALQVVAPLLMAFLGGEILLNLLLNLYRPRKAGEVPRPALDSRVLAFVASPDRLAESIGGAISYQFGVDVTRSWAYQLLSRSVLLLVLVVAGVVWLLTCLEVVGPTERAIRIRNGANAGEVGPGLYTKLPWPFETFDSYPATYLQSTELASNRPMNKGPILWTNEHGVSEVYAIVQPTAMVSRPQDTPGAVRDIALVVVEIPLRFRIRNLNDFEQFASDSTREGLLQAIARREAVAYLATRNEDDMLGRALTEISSELRTRVQARFDGMKAGVEVISVAIEGVHPEKNAARSFELIVDNLQKQQGAIEQGRTEAIKTLTAAVGSVELARTITKEIDALRKMRDAKPASDPAAIARQEAAIEALVTKAGGKAGSLIAEARAERWRKHMLERGRAEAFTGQLAAFNAAPDVYRAQLYFHALREMMKGTRVYITPDDPTLTIDLKDISSTGNIFTDPVAPTN